MIFNNHEVLDACPNSHECDLKLATGDKSVTKWDEQLVLLVIAMHVKNNNTFHVRKNVKYIEIQFLYFKPLHNN